MLIDVLKLLFMFLILIKYTINYVIQINFFFFFLKEIKNHEIYLIIN